MVLLVSSLAFLPSFIAAECSISEVEGRGSFLAGVRACVRVVCGSHITLSTFELKQQVSAGKQTSKVTLSYVHIYHKDFVLEYCPVEALVSLELREVRGKLPYYSRFLGLFLVLRRTWKHFAGPSACASMGTIIMSRLQDKIFDRYLQN